MDELAERRKVERAARCKALLDDPYLAEAFAAVEKHLIGTWRVAQMPEAREDAWHELSALGRVKALLTMAVQDGRIAQVQAEGDRRRDAMPRSRI